MARPSKESLAQHFIGRDLDGLRTPAMIINRKVFRENCAAMHSKAKEWGAGFRAHLKTHKVRNLVYIGVYCFILHQTIEGTRLQMISSADKTNAVVVSTLMEAWEVKGSIAVRIQLRQMPL